MNTEQKPRKRIAIYQYRSFSTLRGGTLKTPVTLAKAGYDVTLTVLPPHADAQEVDRMDLQLVPGLTLRRLYLWSRKLPRYRANLLKFAELMLRHAWHVWRSDFDLYVGFDSAGTLPVYFGTRLKRQKVLYFALELFAEQPQMSGRALWRHIDRFLCPRADAIMAVDENRARHMVEHYKAREMPHVIRNTPPYRVVERKHKLDSVLKERGAVQAALYQGLLERGRNIEQMLEAAALFDNGIALVMLGWGEKDYIEEVHAQIEQKGLRDRVVVLPPVPPQDVWDYMASADVGLLVYENLSLNLYYSAGASLKLHEYLMAGLPVIAPNFPGFPEVVAGDRVGRCVDTEDPRAIAGAVNAILADTSEWSAMHERALTVARDKYNWEIDGAKFLQLCEELIAAAGR